MTKPICYECGCGIEGFVAVTWQGQPAHVKRVDCSAALKAKYRALIEAARAVVVADHDTFEGAMSALATALREVEGG